MPEKLRPLSKQEKFRQWRRPAVFTFWLPLGASLLAAAPPTRAQVIGPGSFTTTQTVTAGSYTVQSPLDIDVPVGYALEVGGTASVNLGAGAVSLQSGSTHALFLRDNATVNGGGANLFITATGVQSSGVAVSGASFANLNGASVRTTGGYVQAGATGVSASYGVLVGPGALASLSNATILTEGEGAVGAFASGGFLTLTDTTIHTTAATAAVAASGARLGASGVRANAGGQFAISGTTILTEGELAHGVVVTGSGTLGNAVGLDVQTNGPSAYGASVRNGSTLLLSDANLRTAGAAAHGIDIAGGASVEVTTGSIATQGAGAHGVILSGASAVANELTASDLRISTANGAAFSVTGGTADITLENTTSSSASNQFLLAGATPPAGPVTVNLTARNSSFTGTPRSAATRRRPSGWRAHPASPARSPRRARAPFPWRTAQTGR